jgi:hypothetical protein
MRFINQALKAVAADGVFYVCSVTGYGNTDIMIGHEIVVINFDAILPKRGPGAAE